jgi:hypothetical protein
MPEVQHPLLDTPLAKVPTGPRCGAGHTSRCTNDEG